MASEVRAARAGRPATVTSTVTVAIVNWNTTTAALESARAYLASADVEVQVTIVDNLSSAEERERLRVSAPPDVKVDLAEANLGYGAAVNRVLSRAETTFVCASNADVVPDSAMLARLISVARDDPRIGLAAPRLLGSDVAYHAALPRARTLPLRALLGSWGHRTVADPVDGAVAQVEQPGGACLVARTETWRALGGFDPGFFLWFEDVDLARRALSAGLVNVIVGAAEARHSGAEAFAQADPRLKHAIRLRSLNRYVAKHHPRLVPAVRVTTALAQLLRVRSRAALIEARRLGERG